MKTEWEKVKLERFFTVKKGQAITKRESNPGPYPVILGGREPAYYIDRYNHEGKAIVVSRSGASAGYVSYWNEPIFITDGFLIEPKDDVCYEFVYYLMKNNETRFIGSQKGAAIPHVTPALLYDVDAFLPPLEIQQKIAGILSAYDDLIENNRKQIKLLEETAQKLYKEWFVKLNFPGHENVKIVDGVPEGWSFERIDNFIELLNGFAFKSDSFDNEGKYKIITIKNVQDGAFDSFNVNRVKDVPSKMPDWCNLEIGDILLSLTGNVGRVCLVTSENCLLNQRVAKLKSEYPAYTYTLFRSKDMFIMMNNLANGAAQQNLSPIRTGEQKILKPTQEVISAFENLVSPYIKKELSLFIQIQLLQSARDKLLPRLMNGDINV